MQPKYWSINLLPGVKPAEQKLLIDNNIHSTQELLKRGNNSLSRQALAKELKLNQKQINKWAALADLARIPSVGYQYCGLLLHAGIASVFQLRQTPFNRLHRQVVRLQVATLNRNDLSPPIEMVKQWVDEAKAIQTTNS